VAAVLVMVVLVLVLLYIGRGAPLGELLEGPGVLGQQAAASVGARRRPAGRPWAWRPSEAMGTGRPGRIAARRLPSSTPGW